MKTRTIGNQSVGEIGLGCMGMSFAYGPSDRDENLKTLDRAIELGVNFWDTADMYGAGNNELLVGESLRRHRDSVFLATKFANVYDRSLTSHQDLVEANAPWIVDGTPAYVHRAAEKSLERLGIETIDLYYQHRVDSRVPIEETVGAMAELVQQGRVKYLGLSEASAETIRRAHAVHPIAAVQSEYSLWSRDYENDVIPLCAELGIAFVPYSPLGRGFLTGEIKSVDDLAPEDWRRTNPRFQGENFAANLRIVDEIKALAALKGATPAQIALSWVLAQGSHLIPIPGTRRVSRLEENAVADSVTLTADELAQLATIAPPIGTRYAEAFMEMLNL